jgi:hypothetical protein
MLLFEDSKRLEKALGEEAAAVIAHVLEKTDEKSRQDLAAKTDIQSVRDILPHMATKADLTAVKAEIIKWVAGLLLAQAALVATLVKLL